MSTFAQTPAVIVKVNNIASVCLNKSCHYKYLDDTPQIFQLAMNNTSILIKLTTKMLTPVSNVIVRIDE